jgi:2,3-bisphosphoglycerate-dependent phosphoglycerate mutase
MASTKLILLRHGQSEWNQQNRFTGWVNVGLSEQGIREAQQAGKWLAEQAISIDKTFTSGLFRAQMTAMLCLQPISYTPILLDPQAEPLPTEITRNMMPVYTYPTLNERHYGALQGLNKEAAIAEFGAEQVHIWRRSYAVAPPEGESLHDTAMRCLPTFHNDIMPIIKQQQNVLIVAHGNSLRAIIKHIEQIADDKIHEIELPTATPWIYTYHADTDHFTKD